MAFFPRVPQPPPGVRSGGSLLPFAEAVSSALAEHECSAHGAGERLLVAVELEAKDERSARQRGVDLIFAGIGLLDVPHDVIAIPTSASGSTSTCCPRGNSAARSAA